MKFEKISLGQLENDIELKEIDKQYYYDLPLPKRATKYSAGYDFYAPCDINIASGETVKVPTFIRANLDNSCFLLMLPRSGLGFKYKLTLDNTAGVIDADYYNSDNEGHIWIKMTNNSEKELNIKKGDAIVQGIILSYLVTDSDNACGVRNGGFGSTTK